MTYPNTNSTLQYTNGTNKTSTAISTNILLAVRTQTGHVPIGAVQIMRISEKRTIKMIDEVGTDGHIDSVPSQSTNITGSCARVRFDRLRVAEAFSRGFVHVQSQAYPFDIVIYDSQKADANLKISTIVKNVWIEGIEYTYEINNWVITDNMTWQAEYIYSTLPGNKAVAVGGEIPLTPYSVSNDNWIERATDMGAGGRRGSLDAGGLIDIGSGSTAGIF